MPANKYNFAPCLLGLPALCQHNCVLPTFLLKHSMHTPYPSNPHLYTHQHLQSWPSATDAAPWESWTPVLQTNRFYTNPGRKCLELECFFQNRPSSWRKALHAPWVTFSSKLRVTVSCHNSIRACILMLLDCCHIIHICFITAHLLNVQDIYLWFFQNEKEKKILIL